MRTTSARRCRRTSTLIIPNLGIIVPNMGMMPQQQGGLASALFSKTQRRVLGLLFGNAERSYYANEIVRLAGVGIGTVQRELNKLAAAGLITVRKVGNQKHYQANHESPIFTELQGIALKTFGIADVIREALATLGGDVHYAFIYGSIATGADTARSDIDVMIVGTGLSYGDAVGVLGEVEPRLGRPVNPTLYSPSELRRKLADDSAFLKRLLAQPKIFLIGTEDDLP